MFKDIFPKRLNRYIYLAGKAGETPSAAAENTKTTPAPTYEFLDADTVVGKAKREGDTAINRAERNPVTAAQRERARRGDLQDVRSLNSSTTRLANETAERMKIDQERARRNLISLSDLEAIKKDFRAEKIDYNPNRPPLDISENWESYDSVTALQAAVNSHPEFLGQARVNKGIQLAEVNGYGLVTMRGGLGHVLVRKLESGNMRFFFINNSPQKQG